MAVGTRDAFYNGCECDVEVLYGSEQVVYSVDDLDANPEFSRAADGFWSRTKGGAVQAFLRFVRVDALNLPRAAACLYVAPQHTPSILPEALYRLPHGEVVDNRMTWTDGESVSAILDVC